MSIMLASVASRRSALVWTTSKTSPACLSSIVGRSMSTTQAQKDQDNILPVSAVKKDASFSFFLYKYSHYILYSYYLDFLD